MTKIIAHFYCELADQARSKGDNKEARKLIAAGLDPLDELDVAIEAKSGKLGYGLRKSVQMASSESILIHPASRSQQFSKSAFSGS